MGMTATKEEFRSPHAVQLAHRYCGSVGSTVQVKFCGIGVGMEDGHHTDGSCFGGSAQTFIKSVGPIDGKVVTTGE